MLRRSIRIRLVLGCVAGLLVSAQGCGAKNAGPQLDLTPVAGVVTLDGKPLADATVSIYFQGAAPQGYYGSGAVTDAEGKFQLKTGAALGAVPGNYKATVSRFTDAKGGAIKLEEGMDLEQIKMQGQAKESLPPKYSELEKTELTLTVEKGKTDGYDLVLTSS